jgi:hypothetical protein
VAAAKEVGMGNPAEKNDRAPDMNMLGEHLPRWQEFFWHTKSPNFRITKVKSKRNLAL